MNIEVYIIETKSRKGYRVVSYNQNIDNQRDRMWSGLNINGDLSTEANLDMRKTYRVLMMDLDEDKPYMQLNNVRLVSCTTTSNDDIYRYEFQSQGGLIFPEMEFGWDDFTVDGKQFSCERKVSFEF